MWGTVQFDHLCMGSLTAEGDPDTGKGSLGLRQKGNSLILLGRARRNMSSATSATAYIAGAGTVRASYGGGCSAAPAASAVKIFSGVIGPCSAPFLSKE